MMTRKYFRVVLGFVIGLAICIGALAIFDMSSYKPNNMNFASMTPAKTLDNRLVLTIDACSEIADKSIMHLSAVVEFQKLEIAGRKVRVLENCMKDKGYKENPAWVKFTESLIKRNVSSAGISSNEAYETIRRKDMLDYLPTKTKPLYWIASGQ